ncbi:XRE family transcriptional regulator [Chryseobacterium indologenes]|uniref:LexA family transcriptional regulator n=1 Tax=Chryseobacterium indologenes TaxID=253 RepID=UPI0021A58357|nr:LexA family transcriptional regulator [Elizabethkingia anophelis]
MSIFSDNIRFLRDKKGLSQQSFADDILNIGRDRYAKYENGRSEAPYEILITMSKYFNISIDLLLTVDIRKYPLDEMLKLPDNRIILPVIVDPQGNNYIEIVPQKASMGYLKGYSDPEYIENLPRMLLPFLNNGKYRGFIADGDSMPPFEDGSCIIGEYVEKFADLKPGKEYIFVTSEGTTFKTFISKTNKKITLLADNSFYKPYEILMEQILEIWKYKRGILPENYKPQKYEIHSLQHILQDLKKEITKLDKHIMSNEA